MSDEPAGRTFTDRHRVGAADVAADGSAHVFAVARWLQETAFADGLDSGFGADAFWIIRRLRLDIRRLPSFPEELTVTTWCSGKAKSVAERTTTITGDGGADCHRRGDLGPRRSGDAAAGATAGGVRADLRTERRRPQGPRLAPPPGRAPGRCRALRLVVRQIADRPRRPRQQPLVLAAGRGAPRPADRRRSDRHPRGRVPLRDRSRARQRSTAPTGCSGSATPPGPSPARSPRRPLDQP